MREYNRVLKTAAALTLLSVVAATSSTLAWLQTRRTLSVSFSDATVRTDSTNLQVEFKHSFNTMSDTKESFSVLKLTTDSKVTDVSSDGIKFYEPVWSGTPNTIENGGDGKSDYLVTQINDITPRKPGTQSPGDPGVTADRKFIDFTLTISRDELSTTGMYVFLGDETAITNITGGVHALDVLSAIRMAAITYDDLSFDTGSPETLFIHAPEVEPDPTYLVESGSGAYGSVGFSFAQNVELNHNPFVTYFDYNDAISQYPPLADLTIASGNTSADVTFRLWIEGTDKDALGPVVSQEFALTLDIYALYVE